ncbi:MAG: hypothetical protein CVV64_02555 [Candidatus Wallbacteria bacterium HGW-Wallbacteria-1]|uniref:Uncharacterized protein n=1 Tax=Candidatus Wallbacteria bacterium HGW-Wallbacteria-1 TaxID=2013854 RepID=A0A2N1PVE2_9BACT|nr:MAG: hypothetical protein CVV64_02555 [Candidatus Wallbacteria bacterium HGW-Wallbacteria-1]
MILLGTLSHLVWHNSTSPQYHLISAESANSGKLDIALLKIAVIPSHLEINHALDHRRRSHN